MKLKLEKVSLTPPKELRELLVDLGDGENSGQYQDTVADPDSGVDVQRHWIELKP